MTQEINWLPVENAEVTIRYNKHLVVIPAVDVNTNAVMKLYYRGKMMEVWYVHNGELCNKTSDLRKPKKSKS